MRGNPKVEIRNPKEGRNPKAEGGAHNSVVRVSTAGTPDLSGSSVGRPRNCRITVAFRQQKLAQQSCALRLRPSDFKHRGAQ
jgi:hypothetical protein